MPTGRIKNWSDFQHYKDRSPPWIKLHRGLLDNFDYARLPIASKALAPLLWLLAAESNDGTVNVDPAYLSFRTRISVDEVNEGLNPLIHLGFVEVASNVLAECLQDACLEREGETEGEGEIRKASPSSSAGADPAPEAPVEPEKHDPIPPCPHAEIVALYHELLPANPRIKVWDGARADQLRTRWREDKKRQSLDYWRRYFAHVAASPFLTGKRDDNGRPFLPGLDWLVKAANFAKVIEGRYHDRSNP